jgi:tripartite-type tricarboxylate transporter receptor subunit TctC
MGDIFKNSTIGAKRLSAIAGLLVVALSFVLMPMATASTSIAKSKTCISGAGTKVHVAAVCKALAYYKGKNITFIAESAAGSSIDVGDLIMAPVIGKFLGANVNVEPNGNGESIPASDQLAASPPNGLTIGGIETVNDIEDEFSGSGGLNFNPTRLAFLGSAGAESYDLVVQPSSPIKTFGELIASATSSNPITTITESSGQPAMGTRLLDAAFNIHADYITGYTNSLAMLAGFQRGDGIMNFNTVENMATPIKDGQATVLLQTAALKSSNSDYSIYENVPKLSTLAAKYPPTTEAEKQAMKGVLNLFSLAAFPYVAPTKTPGDDLDALRAALKYALTSGTVVHQLNASGNPTGYISGPNAKSSYLHLESIMQPLLKFLGVTA